MAGWWDAIVVGAGPAGCIAAQRLAADGARVALLEALAIPRYKTCGGGVVGRALRRLPITIDAATRVSCTRAEFELVDAGFRHTVVRERPIVAMTLRADFDAALATAARDAGAQLRTHCAVSTLRRIEGGVEVGSGRDLHRTRFVVAADGAAGKTRRLSGWARPLPRVPAIEWEAVTKQPVRGPAAETARFFFGLGERGYAWIFPKRRFLSVGALSTARGARGLREELEETLRRAGVGELSSVRQHGFVIPTRLRDEPVARDRVLLAGDAGGFTDPITWEGISHACTSGRLAGEALLASEFRVGEVEERYAAAIEREVLSELRWARRLSGLLYGPTWLRQQLFGLCGEELCEAMTDIVLGDSSYGALARTPRLYARLAARVATSALPWNRARAFP